MKKTIKIFVVCFCLIALLSLSCFAISEGVYGHYIKPGDYIISQDAFDNSLLEGFYLEVGSFTYRSSDYIWYAMDFDNGFFEFYYRDQAGMEYVQAYNAGSGWINDDFRYITIDEGFYISDPLQYSWWMANVSPDLPYQYGLLDGILASFVTVGEWISGASSDLTAMFLNNSSLTFLGTLSVAGLAFAVAFLIIGLIQRFLHFRG